MGREALAGMAWHGVCRAPWFGSLGQAVAAGWLMQCGAPFMILHPRPHGACSQVAEHSRGLLFRTPQPLVIEACHLPVHSMYAGTCELFDAAPALADEPEEGPPRPAADQQEQAGGLPGWVPRHVRPVYKTQLCMYYPAGECQRGAMCWFAHGRRELRAPHFGGSLPRADGQETDGDSDSD